MKLGTTLNEEMTKRYETVKEHIGAKNNHTVLAGLISEEYSRIQNAKYHRLFLPKETYDAAEKAAEARGQTIDEYIGELTEKMLKNAEEAAKHGN